MNINVWECEADYGMPSAHMILVVSTYYLCKVLFYCNDNFLILTSDEKRRESQNETFKSNFDFTLFPLYYE